MAELFDVDVSTVNYHLREIYTSGELTEEATIGIFPIVRQEGFRQVTRPIQHYNLDAIISVGYRVNSIRATQFRQWATMLLMNPTLTVLWNKPSKLKHLVPRLVQLNAML